jgi:deoxyribodipyrimidine photo-lyase
MINERRVRKLNTKDIGEGPIVYWMNRDGRAHDNWALLYAQQIALEKKAPLLVVYNLALGFLGGGLRQHDFKVRGLQEVQEYLTEHNIPFFILLCEHTEKDIVHFADEHKAGAIVTDFFPVHISKKWTDYVARHTATAVYQVDAHNIIPCWVASDKQEFAAHTFRPKVHKLITEFLDEFPVLKKHQYYYDKKVPDIDWKHILNDKSINQEITVADWCTPGYVAGMKELKHFIVTKLEKYDGARNDATIDGQSNLSPWLHYGQIAPQRVVLEVLKVSEKKITHIIHEKKNGSGESGDSVAAFIEELVVRRELADNFCYYNEQYDRVDGFPEWAQKSLAKHAHDTREHVYTLATFQQAQTHDALWNSAQTQLLRTGKMHGYMRMYWAKKILEWSKSPKEALRIAITLNDQYELDGRDPNGYTGVAWSIGGVHDRPWFTRPIFGEVRYMAQSGCEKRFKVKEYIEKWNPRNSGLLA